MALPDLDGDGVGDLAAGAPGLVSCPPYGTGCLGSDRGRVLLLSGADGSLIGEWTGDTEGHLFGRRMALAGDLDQDGGGDVAVTSDADGGEVWILSTATGATLLSLRDDTPGSQFGQDLVTLPDGPASGVRFAVLRDPEP